MIISAEEVRNYVDSDEPASMLEAKLRALESLIRRFTNNNFQVRAIRSRSAIMDGKILKPPPYLKQGDTVQISESLLNNGVYAVTELDEDGMTVDGELKSCVKNLITKVEYPEDIVMGVINMLKWDLNNRDKVGVQSETLSRHSVTYFNMDRDNSLIGYPKSLTDFLIPYMKAMF